MGPSPSVRPQLDRFDVVGLVLVVAFGGWVAFVAGDGAGQAGPVLSLLAGIVLAFAVGRVLAPRSGLVERVLAIGIAGAVLLTWPGLLDSGGAPTGYANANATLTSLGAVAALAAARASKTVVERRTWFVVAGSFAMSTFLTGSVAGSASLATALALVVVAQILRRPAIAVVGGLLAVGGVFAITTVIALGGDPAGLGERAGLRGDLWAAAVDVIEDAPLRGVGPGEFEFRNQVSTDPDLRWAHHGYLQVGAELGVVGLGLVLLLGGWLWAALWRARETRPVELGGAALTIVALHGAVDWVWHVPAVLLVLAALSGVESANVGDVTDQHEHATR